MEENNKGQSSVEFVITLAFSLGILLLYVQLGMNAAKGYLLHWTTYKLSRAYLVYDNQSTQNDESGIETLASDIIKDSGLKVFGIEQNKNLQTTLNAFSDTNIIFDFKGVVGKIKGKISMFPIVGGTEEINFVSESFLGREPTRKNCLERVCSHVMSNSVGFDCNTDVADHRHLTLFDNGC